MPESKAKHVSYSKEEQELLADIEIARKSLYVFKDSGEKQKWVDLLDKAEGEVNGGKNYIYATKLVSRVNEVIDKLWKRIFRWQDIQRQVTTVFAVAIPIELFAIAAYFYFVNIAQHGLYTSMLFGLLGGSLGVALNIGKDLQIDISNRLQMLRLILRPFIGVISAIVLYALLQTKVLIVAPSADAGSVLILLSVFAGFSERFIVKALSDYIPSIMSNKISE